MKKLTLLILLFVSTISFAQISGFWESKEFSKDVSLFKAKSLLIQNILKVSENSLEFEAEPLAAASSGELTTLLYRCENQNLEGLILGFYGNYWDKTAGISYQGYGFKDLPKDKALEFLSKIENEIDEHEKFLKSDNDNNNIVFKYDDLVVMIWTTSGSYEMRIYWNGFDSTWEKTSYSRSKRRFKRKI
jgi:hypothetical protein